MLRRIANLMKKSPARARPTGTPLKSQALPKDKQKSLPSERLTAARATASPRFNGLKAKK
jgi:hypothetical protein